MPKKYYGQNGSTPATDSDSPAPNAQVAVHGAFLASGRPESTSVAFATSASGPGCCSRTSNAIEETDSILSLYIDRKDVELRVSGGALEFHEPAGRRGSVPLSRIERVVLRGRVRLSTSVLGALTEAGAGVLSLSGRQSRHLSTCVGRPHGAPRGYLLRYCIFASHPACLSYTMPPCDSDAVLGVPCRRNTTRDTRHAS